ncbi:hypothetical protein NHF50_12110 [Flavobacterium sp. NRK F10]|uniref:hypothetical protein n=1 Tax=Flavobacterium TaxID=237 RepID=UPI00147500C3|nr:MULTISPECIES: hypothetical protein [Flavobacterium]MCO6175787.1 hypothetical protein [Flavobacterium sp. NRK F10]
MKKIVLTILFFGAGFLAIWEQSKPQPNPFLMIGAMAIFMIGLYQIMKKIPNKKEDDE